MKVKTIMHMFLLVIVTFYLAGCSSQESSQEKGQGASLKTKIKQAQGLEERNSLIPARQLYKEVFAEIADLKGIEDVKAKIEDLNMRILFSRIMDKNSIMYEVRKGDTLGEIAKKFNTTVDLIKQANGLTSDIIMVGDSLKIAKAKFSVVVDKSQNLLFLKKDDEVFKTYVVSTGIDGVTPTGTFTVVNRMKDPVWFRKDIGAVVPAGSAENILGPRWIGINKEGYGIHGTNQPETLGTQETKGCIRMDNEELKEVFAILPRGAEVTILE